MWYNRAWYGIRAQKRPFPQKIRKRGFCPTDRLIEFLNASYTAYHAVENASDLLLKNGFVPLSETEDWTLAEGGKYFVVRGGSALIAFTVGDLGRFAFKIIASHTDSPALKLKENAVSASGPLYPAQRRKIRRRHLVQLFRPAP